MLFSYYDDYYGSLTVTPQTIDFGLVTGAVQATVTILNNYSEPVELENIFTDTLVNAAVVSPTSFPVVIPPFGTYEVVFTTAFEDGNGVSGYATLDFSGGVDSVAVTMTSQPLIRLWPWLPNWDDSYTEEYEFKTDIFTSRNGYEQRRAGRNTPRQRLSFTQAMKGQALRNFIRKMDSWQKDEFALPMLPRYMELAADAFSGDNEVNVVSVPAWMAPGQTLVFRNSDSLELRRVDEIDGVTLTLNASLEFDWAAGSRAHQSFIGYMNTEIQLVHRTSQVAEAGIQFNDDPGISPFVEPPAPDVVFNDREVFLLKPNWGEAINITHMVGTELVDFNVGRISRVNPVGFPAHVWRATYLQKDPEDIEKIRQMFLRLRGQQGEFYMPSWENDLPPMLGLNAGANTLRVANRDVYDAYADSEVFDAVMVRLNDGNYIFKLVDSITLAGSDSLLHMTTNWSDTVSLSDIMMVCWMPVRRFATDILTLEWLTNQTGQTQLTLQTLPDLIPEGV